MTTFLYQPPRPDRKIKAMRGRAPNRQLDDTAEYIARGGLPVNPHVLKAVKEGLASGVLHEQPEKLAELVKSDPGLLFHVAKGLRSVVDEVRDGLDPLEQLKVLEQEKLERLFATSEREISVHRLREATPAQILRYQHAIISAKTAEALAPSADIPADIAFSGASLRQLGHSLLAWNYPEIYARALLRQRTKGIPLEGELKKLLGLSPAEIGARFAAEWQLKPELRRALSPASPEQGSAISTRGQGDERLSLAELLDVSDLFAKANDPQHYPKAQEQWRAVEEVLERALGVKVSELASPKIKEAFSYLEGQGARRIDTPFFRHDEPAGDLTESQKQLLESNQYLKRCPSDAQTALRKVYQLTDPLQVSVNALRYLVDRIVPELGFSSGCLYLFKRESGMLRPALRVGDTPLEQYRACKENESGPVSGSLSSTVTLAQQTRRPDGSETIRLYGSILNDTHPGVLALEVSPDKVEDVHHDASILFNAIRKCMGQCLGESASSNR
jgi:hypothetical protein